MEYQVPQFIEVENKIVGPLTLRQFIYLAGAGGFCIVFFAYLPVVFALLLALPIIGLGVTLAFYKINGKPFIEVLEAGTRYYTGSKLLLWKHQESRPETPAVTAAAEAEKAAAPRSASHLTRGKLSELAWSLDVQKPARTGKSTP